MLFVDNFQEFDLECFDIGYFVDNRFGSDTDFILRFLNYYDNIHNLNISHYYKNKNEGLFNTYKYYNCIIEELYFIHRNDNCLTKTVDFGKRQIYRYPEMGDISRNG